MASRLAPDRLALATLRALPSRIGRPAFEPSALRIGIVHLGLGAFHRAHQAIYTDEAIASSGGDWGICGVSLRSAGVRDRLRAQDGLYTAIEKSAGGVGRRIVGSVREALFLDDDRGAIMARLAAPSTSIVTLTVTEKGYCHDPSSGRLDLAHPDIVHDLGNRDAPRSVTGLLCAAFDARRRAHGMPLSIVCCDNLPHNGALLRAIAVEHAHALDPALAAWIAQAIAFPSTMVDRIVPGITERDIADNDVALGVHDAAPVVFEPFRQWVIEDRFAAARPQWEAGGAQLVGDVAPFELLKLRMLNGSHSAMAYLGYLAGYDYIHQVAGDPRFARLVDGLWDESGSTLSLAAGIDVAAYRRALWSRYGNSALPHRTWQIAMDGSQKLPPRILNPVRDRLRAGASIGHLAWAVAGWMRYVRGIDEKGVKIDVRDPLVSRFADVFRDAGGDPDAEARGLIAIRPIFGDDLAEDAGFIRAVLDRHRALAVEGVQQALDRSFG